MTDITKCTGEGCPFAQNCYRFTAIGDPYYQSYFVEVPYKEGEGCKLYWSITTRKQVDER